MKVLIILAAVLAAVVARSAIRRPADEDYMPSSDNGGKCRLVAEWSKIWFSNQIQGSGRAGASGKYRQNVNCSGDRVV